MTMAMPEQGFQSGRTIWLLAGLAPVALLGLGYLIGFPPGFRGFETPTGWLLLLMALATTVTDLRDRRIPNWISYSALGWGALLVSAGYLSGHSGGWGCPSPMGALAGFALGAGSLGALYAFYGGGAGDVKLAAAAGVLLGPANLIEVLVGGCLSAGLAASLLVFWRVLFPVDATATWQARLARAMRGNLPMAPFFLVGLVLHWTPDDFFTLVGQWLPG